MARRTAAAIAALVLLAPATAHADEIRPPAEELPEPHVVLKTGEGILWAPGGRDFVLPVGTHILAPPAWSELDLEFKRLQEAEVRLTAENKSFRATASEWRPGWKTIALTLAVGLAGGVYVASKF